MEHPVPQNITSFEFHLVGDMTLRQFAFLATGCVLAYLTFLILFSHNPVIAIILMIIFALSGALFAFIPIADRPLDHWVLAFFRAIYSPTFSSWKNPFAKKDKVIKTDPIFQNRLQNYLVAHNLEVSAPKINPVVSINSAPESIPLPKLIRMDPKIIPTAPPLPSLVKNQAILNLTQQIQSLQEQIIQTEQKLSLLKSQQAQSQVIAQASASLQTLVAEEQALAKQTAAIPLPPKFAPKTPVVTIADKPKIVQRSIVLTSLPNVINGIVTDFSGNYIENVIMIIHNMDGIPVRASKTNKLGQFSGATPLPAGTYNVTFEKEGLNFETLNINLNNEILPALNIQPMKGNL